MRVNMKVSQIRVLCSICYPLYHAELTKNMNKKSMQLLFYTEVGLIVASWLFYMLYILPSEHSITPELVAFLILLFLGSVFFTYKITRSINRGMEANPSSNQFTPQHAVIRIGVQIILSGCVIVLLSISTASSYCLLGWLLWWMISFYGLKGIIKHLKSTHESVVTTL